MADIEFDEIDKAVNDLMANVDTSKRPAGLDEPEEKVVTLSSSDATATAASTAPAPAVPSVATPATPVAATSVAPVSSTPEVPPTGPSLAMKRRGQFMDIVHPSRDMNTPKPVGRQGVTIQPGNDVVAASAAQQNEAPIANSVEPMQQPAEASVPSAWPDPIDMASAPTETSTAPTLASDNPVEVATEAPLTSPFLPDAKPEKRPLGGQLSAEDTSSSEPEAPVSDTQTPVTPDSTPAVVLPEEFSGDLMAVESRDLSSPSEQPVVIPSPAEQPKLEAGEEELLIPAVASPDPIEQPQAPAQSQTQLPAGGSIAQQYTEQPSSGDQSNGSIYDTSAYHQPIEPVVPAKKKTPTSVWIMVGVGLLLLGAIGGAAYFYFTR